MWRPDRTSSAAAGLRGPIVSLEGPCGAGKTTLWRALRGNCRRAIPEYAALPKGLTQRDSLPGWPACAAEERLSRAYYAALEQRIWQAYASNDDDTMEPRDAPIELPVTLRDKAFFFSIGFGLCWGANSGGPVARSTLQLYQRMVSRAEVRLPTHLVILQRGERVRLQQLKRRLALGSPWREKFARLLEVDRAYVGFLEQLEQQVYLPSKVLRISDHGRTTQGQVFRWLEAIASEGGDVDEGQVERFLRLRLMSDEPSGGVEGD